MNTGFCPVCGMYEAGNTCCPSTSDVGDARPTCEACNMHTDDDGECGLCVNCNVPLCVHGEAYSLGAWETVYDVPCDLWDAHKKCPCCGVGPLHATESDDEGRCAMCARLSDEDYVIGRYTTAYCLMEMWDMPTSVYRATNATLALRRARRAGCDVLENPRVMESLEMVAGLR